MDAQQPAQQKIIPNIWYNGDAEEAAAFYVDAFEDAQSRIDMRYPEEGLLDFQRHMAGKALTVALTISGFELILINAGDDFHPTPAISFMLNFDPAAFGSEDRAREALDGLWSALSEDGVVRMELGEYPFSSHYGWVEDRYGVNWQLMLTDPAGDPRPFVIPALMFGGAAQDRAAEAADLYVSLFPDAEVGNRVPYGQPTGPASAEALQFGEFRIGDQWFMASDFGYDHDFTFTNGVSLAVMCDGQEEIDRLWDSLSTVPEAEVCGWCIDQFGVSWQIVPANQDELMQRPGAYEHMMGMKKLVIADF